MFRHKQIAVKLISDQASHTVTLSHCHTVKCLHQYTLQGACSVQDCDLWCQHVIHFSNNDIRTNLFCNKKSLLSGLSPYILERENIIIFWGGAAMNEELWSDCDGVGDATGRQLSKVSAQPRTWRVVVRIMRLIAPDVSLVLPNSPVDHAADRAVVREGAPWLVGSPAVPSGAGVSSGLPRISLLCREISPAILCSVCMSYLSHIYSALEKPFLLFKKKNTQTSKMSQSERSIIESVVYCTEHHTDLIHHGSLRRRKRWRKTFFYDVGKSFKVSFKVYLKFMEYSHFSIFQTISSSGSSHL